MMHEKIFSRSDGSRVKITATLSIGYIRDDQPRWNFSVLICEARKRIWKGVADTDSYTYRKLSMEDRRKKKEADYLKVATEEEVLATKLELWEKLKPVN